MRPGLCAALAAVLAAGGLGGCGAPARGLPTESVVATVSVFYATDRAAESDDPERARYGWQRRYQEGGVSYDTGICEVEIRRERNHDRASPLPRAPSDVVRLASVTALPQHRFYERLREMMWYADANELFVFVHGYNNTFETAARRTAELWYDTGFQGPPVMFSWPSRGGTFMQGVFGYFADSETMKWSAGHLKQFLLDLVEQTSADRLHADGPARIHLIGHSMGCRALTRAMMSVAEDLRRGDPPLFCDVILAAPDIDRDLFRDVIAVRLLESGIAEHYTLYASSTDNVIKMSGRLQVYPRAGSADAGLVAIYHPAFDTIDASGLANDWLSLNHDYFITEPRLIRDLIAVLRDGDRNPGSPDRAMQRRAEGPGQPWVLLPEQRTVQAAVGQ